MNMSAREAILAKIRAKTASPASEQPDYAPDFSLELPQPDYGFDIEANKTAQFIAMLQQVHGTVDTLTKLDDVPHAAARYLTKSGVELRAVITDETLTRLDWNDLTVASRTAHKADRTSITLAFAGIAETGTIAMVSTPQAPVSLNFLPEINLVVLLESRLLVTMEQFWQKIKTQPRAINFITGPSKTGDIEQTIIYGAHGPKQFHVILVKN